MILNIIYTTDTFLIYSFTDPSVMPVTKYFCMNG